MEPLHPSVATNWIESKRGHLFLLGSLGLLAFFFNLSGSLFGCMEGMYAEITEKMISSGDFVHLVHQSVPYYNKPPLFFWLQALSREVLGWNEVALRLPSVLCSLGTMFLTYSFGKILFSRTAGFWAALVVGTSYISVWFGGLAIIDPILTFFMTLGLWAFIRGYFGNETPWWYVIGFVGLALGTMVKNLQAFFLPLILFLVLLWVLRDGKPLKSLPFWTGLVLFGALLGLYYGFLGREFWEHFFFEENLKRLTMVAGDSQSSAIKAYVGSRPLPWYLAILWFDFFPWSVLIPSCVLLYWKSRPLHRYPRETFLVLWVLVYLLVLSFVPEKHERYLLPVIPGIALLIGYFYDRRWCSEKGTKWEGIILKTMLGILSLVFLGLILLGPFIIQKKWNITTPIFPILYQGVMLGGAGLLMFFVLRSRLGSALTTVGILAIGFMIGLVVFIVPGINAVASPKLLFEEVRAALRHPDDPIRTFQHWNWRHDEDQYYWRAVHKYDRILAEDLGDQEALKVLKDEIRTVGPVILMVTESQYRRLLSQDPQLAVTVLRKFLRPTVTIFLVSIDDRL